jgi:hypothetical protein
MARSSRRQRVSERNGNFCFVSKAVGPRANHVAMPVPAARTDGGIVLGSLGERPADASARNQLHRPGRRRGVLHSAQPRLARRFRHVPSWRPVANRVQERLGQMPSENRPELFKPLAWVSTVGARCRWRMAHRYPWAWRCSSGIQATQSRRGREVMRQSTVHTRAGRDSRSLSLRKETK